MQTSRPVSAGGLGVRTANQIVLPDFLSSMIGCTDLCQASRSELQEVKGSHSKTHGSQRSDQASFALSGDSLTSGTGQAVPLR